MPAAFGPRLHEESCHRVVMGSQVSCPNSLDWK